MSFSSAVPILLAVLLLGTSCDRGNGIVKGEIPQEIKQFQERRDLCDHFRGEEGYDQERRRFLLEQMKTYCTGSDDRLRALRLKYAKNKAVLDSLKNYEDRIE